MNKLERQENLVKVLQESTVKSVSELSTKLGASMMTIRRDLDLLEQQGILQKIHGGAVILQKGTDESSIAQPSFQQRMNEFRDYKDKIGREAAKHIRNEDVVFFDAGTTTLAMTTHIPDNIEFTAITTGLITAVSLCNLKNANVITIGGGAHNSSYSSVNHMAIEMIKQLSANTAFISTKALVCSSGTFEGTLPLIEVKRAIVRSSERVILLADHSKFGAKSLSESIAIENIDLVITDELAPREMVDELRKHTEVIVVT